MPPVDFGLLILPKSQTKTEVTVLIVAIVLILITKKKLCCLNAETGRTMSGFTGWPLSSSIHKIKVNKKLE